MGAATASRGTATSKTAKRATMASAGAGMLASGPRTSKTGWPGREALEPAVKEASRCSKRRSAYVKKGHGWAMNGFFLRPLDQPI